MAALATLALGRWREGGARGKLTALRGSSIKEKIDLRRPARDASAVRSLRPSLAMGPARCCDSLLYLHGNWRNLEWRIRAEQSCEIPSLLL